MKPDCWLELRLKLLKPDCWLELGLKLLKPDWLGSLQLIQYQPFLPLL